MQLTIKLTKRHEKILLTLANNKPKSIPKVARGLLTNAIECSGKMMDLIKNPPPALIVVKTVEEERDLLT